MFSNRDKAILIRTKEHNIVNKTTANLISGEKIAEPTPPNKSPLAKSKNKLANPLACSEFKEIRTILI